MEFDVESIMNSYFSITCNTVTQLCSNIRRDLRETERERESGRDFSLIENKERESFQLSFQLANFIVIKISLIVYIKSS